MIGRKVRFSRTHKKLLVSAFFTFCIFFIAEVFVTEVFASPRAMIESKEKSFGAVVEGTIVDASFTVKNLGDQPLVIQRGTAPCGCTVVGISQPVTIQPAASFDVKVSFDTSGKSGSQEKVATLYFNDPDQSSIDLSLVGSVEAIAEFSPQRISFTDVAINESVSSDLKITPKRGFLVTEVKTYSNKISVEKSTSGVYRVLYKALSAGEVRDRVVVFLRNEKGDEVTAQIPVYARVATGVVFKPSVISFGVVEGASPLSKVVRIENKEKRTKISISHISSTEPYVTYSVEEKKAGSVFDLTVNVDPTGNFGDELKATVTATLGDGREIVLPVLGIRPPKDEA